MFESRQEYSLDLSIFKYMYPVVHITLEPIMNFSPALYTYDAILSNIRARLKMNANRWALSYLKCYIEYKEITSPPHHQSAVWISMHNES